MINSKNLFIRTSLGLALALPSFDAVAVKPPESIDGAKSGRPVGKKSAPKAKPEKQVAPKAAAPRTDTILLNFGQVLGIHRTIRTSNHSLNDAEKKNLDDMTAQIENSHRLGELQLTDSCKGFYYDFHRQVLFCRGEYRFDYTSIFEDKLNYKLIETILKNPVKLAAPATKPKSTDGLKLVPRPTGEVRFNTEESLKILRVAHTILYPKARYLESPDRALDVHPATVLFFTRLEARKNPKAPPFTLTYNFKQKEFKGITDNFLNLHKELDDSPLFKTINAEVEKTMLELLTLRQIDKEKAAAKKKGESAKTAPKAAKAIAPKPAKPAAKPGKKPKK